jgi:hypothetical protein
MRAARLRRSPSQLLPARTPQFTAAASLPTIACSGMALFDEPLRSRFWGTLRERGGGDHHCHGDVRHRVGWYLQPMYTLFQAQDRRLCPIAGGPDVQLLSLPAQGFPADRPPHGLLDPGGAAFRF